MSPVLIENLKTKKINNYYPILVKEMDSELYLVDGVKRFIHAYRNNDEIGCMMISDPHDEIDFWAMESLRINENGRDFSLLQKLCFLNFILDRKVESQKYFKLLKIPYDKKIIQLINQINQIDKDIIFLVAEEIMSANNLPLWLKFDYEEILKIHQLISGLKLNQNYEKKIASLFWHLKVTDLKVFNQFLSDKDLLEELNLTAPKKIVYLIEELEKSCFPHLTKREIRFQQWIGSLKIAQNISIQPLDHFEENQFNCQFKFSSKEDFSDQLEYLTQLMKHDNFDELFSIVFDE